MNNPWHFGFWSRRNVSILLGCAAVLLYAQTLFSPFVNYDDWWLVAQPKMETRLTMEGLSRIFFDFSKEARMEHGAEYLPLRDVSAALQYKFFGEKPGPYHVVAVLLFSASTVLFYLFLLQMGLSLFTAGAAALLFALHPIHVESVAWLSGHKDLLSLVFLLTSFFAYASNRFRLSFLAFVLALGAKYLVCVAPLLLPLLDRIQGRKFSLRRFSPFLLTGVSAGLLFLYVGDVVRYAHYDLERSVPELFKSLPLLLDGYVMHLISPLHLQIFYPFPEVFGWLDPRMGRGMSAFAFLLFLMIWGWRRNPLLSLSAACFVFFLLPSLRAPTMHIWADRYLLIPSLGFCLFLSLGMASIRSVSGRRILLLLFVLFYAGLTVKQNVVWSSSFRLWENAAVGEQPVHRKVWENLAMLARDQGRWSTSRNIYLYLLRSVPAGAKHRAGYWVQVGNAELALRRDQDARGSFERALALHPKLFEAHQNLGTFWARQGNLRRAQKAWAQAERIHPKDPTLLANQVQLALDLKDQKRARSYVRRLARIAPNHPRLPDFRAFLTQK